MPSSAARSAAACSRPPRAASSSLRTSSGDAFSSVRRNSAARGPSRMLARLPLAILEDLLRQLAVRIGRRAIRIVLKDRHALHGGFREPDGLPDAGCEHSVPEVLLEDLDGLLRVNRPGVDERGQNALDLDVRIQVLANHRERVLQLDQPPHRQILALHGDDHLVGGRQGVDRQQSETRRRVDADEVVVLENRPERLLERALAADLRRHRDLRAGEVDRRARDVDLALADDLADRRVVDEHVVHRHLERVGVDPLRHRQVALRVEVHAEDAVPRLGEGDREVEGRCGLGDAALLVGEDDDLGLAIHGVAPVCVRIGHQRLYSHGERGILPRRYPQAPMEGLLDKRLLFVTGKGGVGKSTVAAALGLVAARRGLRTIVAEIAGQDRLARALARDGAGGGFEETELAPGLSTISIDPQHALNEYLRLQMPARPMADLLTSSRMFQYFTAATPGMRELVTIGKVWELAQLERR